MGDQNVKRDCYAEAVRDLATMDHVAEPLKGVLRDCASIMDVQADEIAALRERVGALEEAAQAFLAKHDVCAPHVAEAFQHRQLRCGEYGGPNYIEELKALRAILAQQGGEGG